MDEPMPVEGAYFINARHKKKDEEVTHWGRLGIFRRTTGLGVVRVSLRVPSPMHHQALRG
jgi:hypothetical protein